MPNVFEILTDTFKENSSKSNLFGVILKWKHIPKLWDVKSVLYNNRIKKQIVLQELAAKFSIVANEISRKLHKMRTYFYSEVRKVRIKNSGIGEYIGLF